MQQEVTVIEAAKLAGRSQRTIRRWIKSGKLKAQQVTPNHYAIKVADLYSVTGRDPLEVSALLGRVEILEALQKEQQAQIQESGRQLDALMSERQPSSPIHTTPPSPKPQERNQVHQTPGGLPFGSVPLNQFAEAHNISHEALQDQVRAGELDATPASYGKRTQHWLSPEQQEKLIHEWNKTGKKYTTCQECPHRSSI